VKTATAHIFLVIAALFWSLGGVLIKMLDLHPIAIAGARSTITMLIFLGLIKKPKMEWNAYMVVGVLTYTAMVFLFVASTKLTTAANAILLQYTAPIYVAIFGYWLLNEGVDWLDWVSMAVIFTGLGLFFMDELSFSGFWGNIMALFGGVCFALFTVILRKQKSKLSYEIIFFGNLLTALISLPILIQVMPEIQTFDWGILMVFGVVQLAIPYILYTKALNFVPALDAILIAMLEPILNPIWVFLVVGEKIGNWAFVGGLLVLVGSVGRAVIKNSIKDK
jgi:drug/metabolite transporter (DMT)-like permease